MTSLSPLQAPFLKMITLLPERADVGRFPFDRFAHLLDDEFSLSFERPVTFLVGDNGTGKSTILEAIAGLCGFNPGGGSSDHLLDRSVERGPSLLAEALRPSWLPKVSKGFFFRADTFAEVAGYIDEVGSPAVQGGQQLDLQSHGEAFFAVFAERFGTRERCMYLLDEPENALSPSRQLAFLRLLREWEQSGNAQMIIATHSPILMSYPGAVILAFDGATIEPMEYEDTEHYRVTKGFLSNPERYYSELFSDEGASS